jgi:hypothetical protein
MIHNHWLSIAHHDTPGYWLLIMVVFFEQVVLYHGVFFCAIGCES